MRKKQLEKKERTEKLRKKMEKENENTFKKIMRKLQKCVLCTVNGSSFYIEPFMVPPEDPVCYCEHQSPCWLVELLFLCYLNTNSCSLTFDLGTVA